MRYISTRGEAPALSFTDALLAGLARDGGLYVPEMFPALPRETIAGFAGQPYAQVAETVIGPFVGDEIAPTAFRAMLDDAYAQFRHPAVTPLTQIGDNLFILELFHGPTLAFKDVAMQLLGRMMDHALKARGERATIVGATSGDTGAAAIEAFRGLDQVDVFIMYPHGRVSDIQRKQMTTIDAPNIHTIALEGTFDDCQSILKGLFNNHGFRDSMKLSGVNSINWARVVAQTVYYFTSAAVLGGPHRPVSFTVPTGNFGDILAGYIAKRMGLPVDRLVVATNENDILERTLANGTYEVRGVVPTQSPSMDIQVSSNFERLMFDACGRDAATVRALMASLQQSGRFTLPQDALAKIRAEFDAFRTGETGTANEMSRVHSECGLLIDPHTAVGVHAGRKALAKNPSVPMVVLGTAHPAKFGDAVKKATGSSAPLPPHLAKLAEAREHFTVLPNDQGAIERFVRERARAARP
ncbi:MULTISPECIES: threonine synthase [unclassified Beijerinckia]|uniref:threonine synthase n=1 Tax=unclassified Beijerinckia TaxID=2638183 RepID=UPI00089705E0|nr:MULTISPECIES: threonine synthase [unclassified Beijerinckia]MDH7797441.1 threonine synthase [Beijerinckia sp. GAS462]SEC85671.1 threonine synthase [Beijerinckia sp. 28-YEA-48]